MRVFMLMLLGACVLLAVFVGCSVAAKKNKGQEPHYRNGEHNAKSHDQAYASLEPAELINAVIAEHDVVIFSKSYCPYCKRAKKLFTEQGIEFEAVELDLHPKGNLIQSALQDKTGQRTVPNIFIKGKHLGGSDAAYAAHADGRLAAMLAAARE